MHAVDIVLMSSNQIKELRNKFLVWKEAFKSKSLKVNLISGGITKDGLSKRKVDRCEACSLRVKAISVI